MTTQTIVTLFLLLLTSQRTSTLDKTLENGAFGSLVVEAVVSRIREKRILPEDRLFLRRVAYVASLDGSIEHSIQFGGIWQVTEAALNETRGGCGNVLSFTCSLVLTQLGIDWSTVTWADLQKPMYSGLAAAMLTLLRLNGTQISGNLTAQAQFYGSVFGGSASQFSTLVYDATTTDEPTVGVRLVGGASDLQGRVEVFTDGSWGTVCDDNFDSMDAVVVCRMLGYEGWLPAVYSSSQYGAGQGSVKLDEVQCLGSEASLLQCKNSGPSYIDCSHDEDVGVNCLPPAAPPYKTVRLVVNGSELSQGRLEVLHNGTWATVCDYNFDVNDAIVVCKMLNFTERTPEVHKAAYYGAGTEGQWRFELFCEGTEASIFLCGQQGLGVHDCSHAHDVGVDCYPDIHIPGNFGSTASSASASASGDDTGMVVGLAVGLLSLLLLLAGIGALLANRYYMEKKERKNGEEEEEEEHSGTTSITSSPHNSPISISHLDAKSMASPRDTRLPPLNVPRFPPLRL